MGHKEDRAKRGRLPLPPASEEALTALWKLGECTRDDLARELDGDSESNRRRRAASLLATLQRRGLATLRTAGGGGRFALTAAGRREAQRIANLR